MQLFKYLIGLFIKRNSGVCGGVEYIEIEGRYGVPTDMKIYYNRPTSDLVISYEYDYKNLIENDSKLRDISDDKTKYSEMAEIMIDKLYAPYVKRVFGGCKGFFDENKKPLEKKSVECQFEALHKYYSYYFIDLCTIIFEVNTRVKKKD
jgi:hypothetical protein